MRIKHNRQASIRGITIATFALFMLATVGSMGLIIYSSWIASARKTTAVIAQDLSAEIHHQIDTFLSAPMHVNEVNYRLIENDIIDIGNELQREKFFVGVLQSHGDEIYSFSFGAESGEYYGARRNKSGNIEIMRNNEETGGQSWYYTVDEDSLTAGEIAVKLGKFDVRTRDWYKAAKQSGFPVFSPLYKHFVMDDLTVSAACPIYKTDGTLFGVLGTHMVLSSIDGFLRDIVRDKDGYALIVEKESGYLVANSLNKDNFEVLEDGAVQRTGIDGIGVEALDGAYNKYNDAGSDVLTHAYEKDKLFIKTTEYEKNGLNWVVITALPERLLTAGIFDNAMLSLLLVIVAMAVSIAVYYMLANKLFRPINDLIEVTGKLSGGDLSQRAEVGRNDEIGSLSAAFNQMADTLEGIVATLEATVKDRTEHLEIANASLKENKDQLQLILNSTAEAIYGIDMEGNCTFCNASCLQILGYQKQSDLIGKNMHNIIHHSLRDGTPIATGDCKIIKAYTVGKGSHVDNEVFWKADGTCFDVEYYSYPQYRDGRIVGAVVTFMDNTERKAAEGKIQYLSCHDSLTGLYNRMCFEKELEKIDTNENLPITIAFADVNGLKLTNDIFGHAAGDELLKTAARILQSITREDDVIARVGGDEFVILLPKTSEDRANEIIGKTKEALLNTKVAAVKCSISIGISTKTAADQEIERTMEYAENEMYKEKTINRKTVNSEFIDTIISTLHHKAPQEKRHSAAVSRLCRAIGAAMGLSDNELRKLEEAGFLHDIGKVVLDEDLINKKGKLSEEEISKIQQHAIIGYRILNIFDDKLDLAEAVYSHHERWDGTGYPKGLARQEISLLARIIAVAETYDRIASDSANRKAMAPMEAVQILKENAGMQFDPYIVELFIQHVVDGGG